MIKRTVIYASCIAATLFYGSVAVASDTNSVAHGISVTVQTNAPNRGLASVQVVAPRTTDFASTQIGIAWIRICVSDEKGRPLVESDVAFHQRDDASVFARFSLSKRVLSTSVLTVTYGVGDGTSFDFNIGKELAANKKMHPTNCFALFANQFEGDF